jgi:hypothetical protein
MYVRFHLRKKKELILIESGTDRPHSKLPVLHKTTVRRDWVASTPTFCSTSPGFKSRPGDHLS